MSAAGSFSTSPSTASTSSRSNITLNDGHNGKHRRHPAQMSYTRRSSASTLAGSQNSGRFRSSAGSSDMSSDRWRRGHGFEGGAISHRGPGGGADGGAAGAADPFPSQPVPRASQPDGTQPPTIQLGHQPRGRRP